MWMRCKFLAVYCRLAIACVLLGFLLSDSHEVMTALIVVLPLIVVVEISLQLHRCFYLFPMGHPAVTGFE
jgi:Sec-independent protein secretion pathway component TatC